MPRPPQYEVPAALGRLALWSLVVSAALPFLLAEALARLSQAGLSRAQRTLERRAAGVDRAFAKRCTERLRALRGAAPSVWRRALRDLAREREEREAARAALSDAPCAAARRARARARRDEAWRAWFSALEASAGRPDEALLRANPVRRGPPVRRLCAASVNAPPDPAALAALFEQARGRGRVEQKIRLGSMLLDAEAAVDSSLRRDERGEIVGRNPGLRGWIAENRPALLRHYATLLGYRRLAAQFRDAHGLGDPCPAALLLEADAAAEAKLPPWARAALPAARRRARERLAAPDAAAAKAFAAGLARARTGARDMRRRLA